MWWKLAGLVFCTVLAIYSVIPIRTHAVVIDPTNPPPPLPWFPPLYFTPTTFVVIGVILIVAAIVGVRIVRG